MPRKATTRAAQGSGTIRQRADGTWEARVTVGRDPATGKQKQRSLYGKTQADVRKQLNTIVSSIDAGTYYEPSKMTVGDWLDIWLKEYTLDLKPRALESYEGYVRNYLKPAFEQIKIQQLSTPQIQAMFNRLRTKGGVSGKPFSEKSIKNLYGVLHAALKQALEVGLIQRNPIDPCRIPKVKKPEIHELDDNASLRFIQAVEGHRYQNLYLVDLFTGMRQSEILGLTWDCVGLDVGSVHVCKQLQKIKGVYSFQPTKNNKTRDIPIAPAVIDVFRRQKRLQSEWKLRASDAWDNADNLVFTNPLGGHYCHVTIWENLKRVLRRIGLPSTRFHDLRHSYVVAQIQAGVDIKTIQQNVGHYSAAFTLDQYGHVTDRMRKESADKMQQHITALLGDKKL